MRCLLETATRIAIEVDHPAYDCVYLALAVGNDCEFVTADEHFIRNFYRRQHPTIGRRAILLREAVKA